MACPHSEWCMLDIIVRLGALVLLSVNAKAHIVAHHRVVVDGHARGDLSRHLKRERDLIDTLRAVVMMGYHSDVSRFECSDWCFECCQYAIVIRGVRCSCRVCCLPI